MQITKDAPTVRVNQAMSEAPEDANEHLPAAKPADVEPPKKKARKKSKKAKDMPKRPLSAYNLCKLRRSTR